MSDSELGEDRMVKAIAGVVLLFWLLLVFMLGGNGVFAGAPGALPLPILLAVLTPVIVFLVAMMISGRFRGFVMDIDLPQAIAIQAWRFGGLGFIALYAYGVLPGLFAWPAGLGDMAIGLTAPWIAQALRRNPGFATGGLFRAWNLLGILDLVVAVSLGAISSLGVSQTMSPFPMAVLPLVLVPAFLVPLFIMLHIAALLQAAKAAATGMVCSVTEQVIRCEHVGAMHKA